MGTARPSAISFLARLAADDNWGGVFLNRSSHSISSFKKLLLKNTRFDRYLK